MFLDLHAPGSRQRQVGALGKWRIREGLLEASGLSGTQAAKATDAGVDLYSEQSGIHGLGVFTRAAIAAGTFVIECQGILRHKDEVVEGMRALQIGPETYLAEDPENPRLDDFINHSCAPNVGFTEGSPKLFALRPIAAGEELFWDYRTSINEPGWAVPCTCGAPACRGKIQSYCDLPESERFRLRGIALQYLR
ncbi:MAG: SET domain-containing protein-lysine N-methyltransferase [Fibrobacteria bacterium]